MLISIFSLFHCLNSIFYIFVFVLWWPLRLIFKVVEVTGSLIDSLYESRILFSRSYNFWVVLWFLILMSIVLALNLIFSF